MQAPANTSQAGSLTSTAAPVVSTGTPTSVAPVASGIVASTTATTVGIAETPEAATSATAPLPEATAITGPVVPSVTATTSAEWAPPARAKTTGCVSNSGLPDSGCTPGATDPRVNTGDIAITICTRGYTAKVRPPVAVTDRIKREQMAAYGLQRVRLAEYELDHLIPLELGGAPQDVANLWPQPWTGDANAHMKDAVETYLNREVCRGAIALTEAQRQIATDWLGVYRTRGLSPAD